MATIAGTIRGITCIHKPFAGYGSVTARDTREVWLVTADFAAYTASSDDASLAAVGAAISAQCRDGKTRTLKAAMPAHGGQDSTPQTLYFTGASVDALTISTDTLTGQLSINDRTETDSSGAVVGVGTMVVVSVA